jgi:BirA family transcriptional regulator, biotin operon repressor / biotin---[acetyl-CoA-carboxylase] ligase
LDTIFSTLFIGKVILHYDSVLSTNATALELMATQELSEGTLIVADAQTAGRGQQNTKWEAEPFQNLTLSVVLYPTFLPLQKHFFLNESIALGVHDFVKKYVKKTVTIKWSNDIYVENKKIAGILIQNAIQGTKLQQSIVGIGLNINQTIFRSDAPNPTSFILETAQHYDLDTLCKELCQCLESRYLQLKNGDFERIKKDYALALFHKNKWAKYQRTDNDTVFLGLIEGVKDSGELIMRTQKGIELFDFKTIRFLLS